VSYATVEQLQSALRIESPTAVQLDGMQRALDEAAAEIDWDLNVVNYPLPDPPPPLVVGVNLDRAVEHWRQSFSPFGVIGVGAESEPIITARDSWRRHHLKLAALRQSWGIA
jgi:hypothetical protein